MKKTIVIITNKYPNLVEPNILVFVQQLVWSFVDAGNKCIVISPLAVNLKPSYAKIPHLVTEKTSLGNQVDIYFPQYIGFGQSDIFGMNPARMTTYLFSQAVRKTIKEIDVPIDMLYAHFVTPAGISAARLGKKYAVPAYMAYGEATMMTIDHFGGHRRVAKELESLSGVIAVSTKNKDTLVNNQIIDSERVVVIPNGYNPDRFKKMDKEIARAKFNLPLNAFIVGFVGSFDERKGINRLIEAKHKIGDSVELICAGSGKLTPTKDDSLFTRPVLHQDLPWFYNAMDAFALPTQNEGCSNAIVEALACGLPIISSDATFNYDILDDRNAVLIDPMSIDQLADAILRLRDNPDLRKRMGQASLEKARELTLDKRAGRILEFMVNRSEEKDHDE